MGEQNDILFGILAYDQNRAIVDVQKLGEEPSIRQGELKRYNFSYTVPATLKGTFSIMLIAETKDGLILGGQELAKKAYQGTGSTFSCTTAKTRASVTCTSTVADTLTVSYVTGSIFSASVLKETKDITKGAAASFAPALPPSPYYALVASKLGGGTAATRFVIAGDYGNIQNIAVSKIGSDMISVVVAARAVPSSGATVSVKLTGANGASCGEGTVPLLGIVASFSFADSCTDGTVTATLSSADKTVLDSSTTSFSTKTFVAKMPTNWMSQQNLLGLALAALLLMALGYFLARRKTAAPVPSAIPPAVPPTIPPIAAVILIVGGVLFGGVPAHAVSFGATDFVNGEYSHLCGGSISSDKSSYFPGDTMVLSSVLNIDVDVPSGDSASCSVGYKTDTGQPSPYARYDVQLVGTESAYTAVSSANPVSNSSIPYSTSNSMSFPVYSSLAAGSHYLGLRPCVWTYQPYPTVIGSACTYTSFPFTVTAAATPAVNIFFQ